MPYSHVIKLLDAYTNVRASTDSSSESRRRRRRQSAVIGAPSNRSQPVVTANEPFHGRVSVVREESPPPNAVVRSLNPTPITDFATDGVTMRQDIDSFLLMTRSLKPFVCRLHLRLNMMPNPISVCQNAKLVRYLWEKYVGFDAANNRVVDAQRPMLEFESGTIDDHSVYALFQVDLESPFFQRTEESGESALRNSCFAFVLGCVIKAASYLHVTRKTARSGLPVVREIVNGAMYTVAQPDFIEYARSLDNVVKTVDLLETCGITFLRFYTCQHGLRIPKIGQTVLTCVVELWHEDLEILQVHVADELSLDENRREQDGAILIGLGGGGRSDAHSLASLFRGGVSWGRLEKYKVGRLTGYGYFSKHGSIPGANVPITFAQAYNSATKMATPADCGLVPAYLLLRGFSNVATDKTADRLRGVVRQYARNVETYADKYFKRNNELRLEQVLTLDREDGCILNQLLRYNVFEEGVMCRLTEMLLEQRLVFRLNNWRAHFEAEAGQDLQYWRDHILLPQRYEQQPYVPTQNIQQSMRAEFRLMYFLHGNSQKYNYNLRRYMMPFGNEADDAGFMRLRPLHRCDQDERDGRREKRYPLYSTDIPFPLLNAVQFIWKHRDPQSHPARDLTAYIVSLYSTWAYTRAFLTPQMEKSVDVSEVADEMRANYKKAFTAGYLVERIGRHDKTDYDVKIAGVMRADYISKTILLDPRSPFAKAVRMSVAVDTLTGYLDIFTEFVKTHVQVFPYNVVDATQLSRCWAVVTGGNSAFLPNGEPLLLEGLRAAVRGARAGRRQTTKKQTMKQDRRKTTTRRIICIDSSSSSSSSKKKTARRVATGRGAPKRTIRRRVVLSSSSSDKEQRQHVAIKTTPDRDRHATPPPPTPTSLKPSTSKATPDDRDRRPERHATPPPPTSPKPSTSKATPDDRDRRPERCHATPPTGPVTRSKRRATATKNIQTIELATTIETISRRSTSIRSTSAKSNPRKTKRALAKTNITDDHDAVILRHVLQTGQVTNHRLWSNLIAERPDLFEGSQPTK